MTATTYMLLLLNLVLTKGDSLTNLLEKADSLFFLTLQDSVSSLLTQNAALDTSEWHYWSEKRYNEIALGWLTGTAPDSAATADLRLIAQTCLRDGGRAVLSARGLCEVWLKEHYGEDTCRVITEERSARPVAEMEASPALIVVPNPASDIVRVQLREKQVAKVPLRVQVLTLGGQEIYTGVLSADTGELNIPVRSWPNGLYIVRVTGRAGPLSRTFVVQHN